MTEKRFNVTATLEIFQHIEAETKEEAIIQMKEYINEIGEGGAFDGIGEGNTIIPNTRYLVNIKCEEREKEGGYKK